MFFIKFFFFVEFNFKLELGFIHRKKLYVILFEMFYELIINLEVYENNNMCLDEFLKLIELLIVVIKTYSKLNLEDGYLIYKMMAMVVKKISIGNVNFAKEIGTVNNFNLNDNLNVSDVQTNLKNELMANKFFLNKTQIALIYGLVNTVLYLITG